MHTLFEMFSVCDVCQNKFSIFVTFMGWFPSFRQIQSLTYLFIPVKRCCLIGISSVWFVTQFQDCLFFMFYSQVLFSKSKRDKNNWRFCFFLTGGFCSYDNVDLSSILSNHNIVFMIRLFSSILFYFDYRFFICIC